MRAERLRRIVGDDLETSIALTRENLRSQIYAWRGVPESHRLAAFVALFDAWPDVRSTATYERRECLMNITAATGAWYGSQILDSGETVGSRRRLAVVLCNLWRRLPAPHPMRRRWLRTVNTDLPDHVGDGHALKGYVESLHVALDLPKATHHRLLSWMVEHAAEWRISGSLNVTVGGALRVSCSMARVFESGAITATANFDASCLPIVPMSIAGGDDEQG